MTEPTTPSGRKPARRTLVKGAAWAVPAVAVASAAPAFAASPCVPTFTAEAGSFKCCSGNIKTMKVIIKVTDPTGCIDPAAPICINGVRPRTGNPSVGTTTYVPSNCTTEGGTITVYLYDVSNCTVNLDVFFTVSGGLEQKVQLKSENITDGGDSQCPVLAP